MSNPQLRAKLVEFIEAEDQAAVEILQREAQDLLSDAAEAEMLLWLAEVEAQPDLATRLAVKLELLRELRQFHRNPEMALFGMFMAVNDGRAMAELAQQLPEAALTDLVEIAGRMLSETDDADLAEGIRQRLEGLQQMRAALPPDQASPLIQALLEFLPAGSAAEAQAILLAQPDLLLSVDAGQALSQFAGGDPESQQHLEARRALWAQLYRQRTAPTRPRPAPPAPPMEEQPPSRPVEAWAAPAAESRREAAYTVINPVNSAIGPNALVINNVGRLPLHWKRPLEFQRTLVDEAVGRAEELADLHARLQAGGGTAIVGKGSSTAVQGAPGVGKSTLAALYAAQYADQYPGGILWLSLGPAARDEASVNAHLNRIATYAYEADVQAQAMLQNSQFSAETVRGLLSGHGPLLLVADDVWARAVLEPLRQALPPDGCLLATTRDWRVAHQFAQPLPLDVLAEPDALALIRRKLPDLSDQALMRRLAAAVGYHPLALSVALGDLAERGTDEWPANIEQIAGMVARGEGFGDLPLLDEADRESRVEAVLRHSYTAMAEAGRRRFRALGCLAQEAEFDAAAAAAIWGDDAVAARDYLNVLVARALLTRRPAGRWQQHAILRAYALSLQSDEERLTLPETQAGHYLTVAQSCYERKPRDYDRLEQEFKQVEHAFAWGRQASPRLVSQLALLCDDFMRNRGRVSLLGTWLNSSLRSVLHKSRLL